MDGGGTAPALPRGPCRGRCGGCLRAPWFRGCLCTCARPVCRKRSTRRPRRSPFSGTLTGRSSLSVWVKSSASFLQKHSRVHAKKVAAGAHVLGPRQEPCPGETEDARPTDTGVWPPVLGGAAAWRGLPTRQPSEQEFPPSVVWAAPCTAATASRPAAPEDPQGVMETPTQTPVPPSPRLPRDACGQRLASPGSSHAVAWNEPCSLMSPGRSAKEAAR